MNTQKKMLTTVVAAAAIGLLGSSASANLVTNGGFEPTPAQVTLGFPPSGYVELAGGGDTTINGWTTIPTGVEWFSPAIYGLSPSPEGGFAVDLANYTTTPGGITQTISTTLGTAYEVSFYYGTSTYAGRDGTSAITVTANTLITPFSISTASPDAVWTPESFSFVADGPSTALTFKFTGNPFVNFAFIDGVQVNAVPLPAAAGVGFGMLGGFGALFALRKRLSRRPRIAG